MHVRDLVDMVTIETVADGLVFIFFLRFFYQMFFNGGINQLLKIFGTAFCGS